tara:strand:- start:211 stop:354 length:144 start_codon:yes stop_codon:yes gene_type:complete
MSVVEEGILVLTVLGTIMAMLIGSLGNKEKVGCQSLNCKCKCKKNGK